MMPVFFLLSPVQALVDSKSYYTTCIQLYATNRYKNVNLKYDVTFTLFPSFSLGVPSRIWTLYFSIPTCHATLFSSLETCWTWLLELYCGRLCNKAFEHLCIELAWSSLSPSRRQHSYFAEEYIYCSFVEFIISTFLSSFRLLNRTHCHSTH